jgi:hypothetical protein
VELAYEIAYQPWRCAMKVQAERVSTKKDNVTWCLPSKGYYQKGTVRPTIEVELDEYVPIKTLDRELPECDEQYPQGAPADAYIKYGNQIFKKKGV